MGLRDVLLGRKQLKEAAGERLFALSTAAVTLDTELGLKPAGAAGIVFKPQSSGEFVRAESEMQQLLDGLAAESETKLDRRDDEYGYTWIVLRDPELEDLVTGVHAISSELEAKGFGPQLLAAVFRFEGEGKPVYLIYGYKRGAFWPFVPKGDGQERDNARELELKAKLEGELPIEQDLSRWFATYGAPV